MASQSSSWFSEAVDSALRTAERHTLVTSLPRKLNPGPPLDPYKYEAQVALPLWPLAAIVNLQGGSLVLDDHDRAAALNLLTDKELVAYVMDGPERKLILKIQDRKPSDPSSNGDGSSG